MKINEIAPSRLDEVNPLNIPGVKPVVKYVGPYFDKAAQAAAKLYGAGKGTSQAELDALRASETGAAKSGAAAERPLSTVSSDELNALLYPPRAAEPTVGSFLKRRGDPGFDPDLSNPQALPGYLQNMPPARIDIKAPPKSKPKSDTSAADAYGKEITRNPRMPNKGKPSAEADAFAAEKAARAKKQAAEELAAAERQASGLPADFEPPMSANAPPPAPAAGSTAADVQRYTMDEIRHFQELLSTNPAAAQETAKKMGWWGKAGWTAAGLTALAASPTAINAFRPGTVPDWANPAAYATKGVEKVLAPKPLSKDRAGPEVIEIPADWSPPTPAAPVETPAAPAEKPAASTADSTSDAASDAAMAARVRELLKQKVDESASELNRIVYLSRL